MDHLLLVAGVSQQNVTWLGKNVVKEIGNDFKTGDN